MSSQTLAARTTVRTERARAIYEPSRAADVRFDCIVDEFLVVASIAAWVLFACCLRDAFAMLLTQYAQNES
eukprot:11202738-Lingulodinium_polyedra.AAC.1